MGHTVLLVDDEGNPADTRELLEEMDGAVRNGRELLREVRNGLAGNCEPEGSAASPPR